MTFGHKVDPIGYFKRNGKVIITNDRSMVDFIEFTLSNLKMRYNGMVNVENKEK